MPRFALHFPNISFRYNKQHHTLLVLRPLVKDLCIQGQFIVRPFCLFDSGAPHSILSYTLGDTLKGSLHPVTVDVNPLKRYENGQFIGTKPVTSLTRWWGIDCKLCEMYVELIDSQNPTIRTGPLKLLVKWVQKPRPDIFNDQFLFLGMSFLADNGGKVELAAQSWNGQGAFIFP